MREEGKTPLRRRPRGLRRTLPRLRRSRARRSWASTSGSGPPSTGGGSDTPWTSEYVDAVLTAFIDLFNAGLIYRENRITNWCPHDRSAISDLEVNYEDVEGKLYGLRYPFIDGKGPGPDGENYAQVFSTRPETMLGDIALVVNPEDERYTDLVGRRVEVPFVEREIEVLADELRRSRASAPVSSRSRRRTTPTTSRSAQRLGLPSVNVMNPDGTINENGGPFAGMDREEARKAVAARAGRGGAARRGPRLPAQGRALRQVRGRHRALALRAVVVLDEGAGRARHRGVEEQRDHRLPGFLASGDHTLAGEHPRLERLAPALVGAPHPRLVRPRR